MKSQAVRIFVALSTLVVGLACSRFIQVLKNPDFLSGIVAFEKPKRTYSRGPAGRATEGSFITLYSSDGMSFTKWSVFCRSEEGARRELEKRLKRVARIVSREPLFDRTGEQVGETIVGLVPPMGADYAAATLIWTERDELFQVEGATLSNILEYRKDFKH